MTAVTLFPFAMNWIKWIIPALALLQGGWLTFDGTRAFVTGDYVTPASGPRAGQLGPWSRVVLALGLEPRSPTVKGLHVVLGLAWLVSAVVFALRPAAGWWFVFGCSVATLWYLPAGTIFSIILIILLFLPQARPSP